MLFTRTKLSDPPSMLVVIASQVEPLTGNHRVMSSIFVREPISHLKSIEPALSSPYKECVMYMKNKQYKIDSTFEHLQTLQKQLAETLPSMPSSILVAENVVVAVERADKVLVRSKLRKGSVFFLLKERCISIRLSLAYLRHTEDNKPSVHSTVVGLNSP